MSQTDRQTDTSTIAMTREVFVIK